MLALHALRRYGIALLLAAALAVPARAAIEADPGPFFDRLDAIGLDTEYLRNLATKIEFFYKDSDEDTEASYGYILNNVYIPPDFKQRGSNKIRYDLEVHEISTLIHELAHAAHDVSASEDAPKGTTARHHHDAVNSIWADLFNDPRHQFLGLARYPRMKADEICGYFMGDSISQVVEIAELIVFLNTKLVGKTVSSPEEALALGDRLVLPAESKDALVTRARDKVFGKVGAGNSHAYFEGKNIPWDERQWVKDDMYKHVLGLRPPVDAAEQLRRLNTLDNAWIRKVRAEVKKARQEWAAKQQAQQLRADGARPAEPDGEDVNRSGGGILGMD